MKLWDMAAQFFSPLSIDRLRRWETTSAANPDLSPPIKIEGGRGVEAERIWGRQKIWAIVQNRNQFPVRLICQVRGGIMVARKNFAIRAEECVAIRVGGNDLYVSFLFIDSRDHLPAVPVLCERVRRLEWKHRGVKRLRPGGA